MKPGARCGVALLAAALGGLLSGCSPPTGSPSVRTALAAPAARQDTSLFAAVVRSVEQIPGGPLHIDPRPLRGDPQVLHPSAATLAAVSPELLRSRATVLDRMTIPKTDAIGDIECGIGSMRVQTDSVQTAISGCEGRQRILSVITTLPLAAGSGTTASDSATVRVFAISVAPRFGSHFAEDYVFARDDRLGGWRLVRKVLVFTAG